MLHARLLDGDRDRDVLHRRLDQPGRRPRAGDHRVAARPTSRRSSVTRSSSRSASRSSTASCPGSQDFSAEQSYLQPPAEQTDIVHIIRGVIQAESGAIDFYNQIVEATEGVDPVTNDMVIAILRDEEGHRRLFEGFLREYAAEGRA